MSFLKEFNPNNKALEEIGKLISYANNEAKAQFISDTLSKILFSKSLKSCVIIGIIISYLRDNLNKLPVEYIICVSGLSELFDHDIDNFKYITGYCNNNVVGQRKRQNKVSWFSINKEFKKLAKQNKLNVNSMMLTIEKLVNLQFLFKLYDIDFHSSFDSEFPSADTRECYKLTYVGILLDKFINNINI